MVLLLAQAELPAQTSLSIGNIPGYPATKVNVPVNARKATNIVAAQFDFAYDPAKTRAGGAVLAPLNAGHIVRSREIAPGVRRTIVYSMNNALLRTNGFAATIPFQVPAQERVGSGPIAPSNVILAKRDGTSITPVRLDTGAVFVRTVNPLPDGTVQFFLPSEADTQYLIQATTNFIDWVSLTTTTASGNFMDLVDADAPNFPYRFYRSASPDSLGQLGQLGSSAVLPGGLFVFQLTGLSERDYLIQASTDLRNWEDLRTVTPSGGNILVTNAITAQYPTRFFRLRSNP